MPRSRSVFTRRVKSVTLSTRPAWAGPHWKAGPPSLMRPSCASHVLPHQMKADERGEKPNCHHRLLPGRLKAIAEDDRCPCVGPHDCAGNCEIPPERGVRQAEEVILEGKRGPGRHRQNDDQVGQGRPVQLRQLVSETGHKPGDPWPEYLVVEPEVKRIFTATAAKAAAMTYPIPTARQTPGRREGEHAQGRIYGGQQRDGDEDNSWASGLQDPDALNDRPLGHSDHVEPLRARTAAAMSTIPTAATFTRTSFAPRNWQTASPEPALPGAQASARAAWTSSTS